MRRYLLGSVLVLAIAVPSTGLFAQEGTVTKKPAWQWTTEERLKVRFDPVSIRERYERKQAALRDLRARTGRGGRVAVTAGSAEGHLSNSINGRDNPELFLPFELFILLIRDAFDLDTERGVGKRSRLNPIVETLADPAEFWPALEEAASTLIDAQHEESRRFAQLNAAATDDERDRIRAEMDRLPSQCEMRRQALDNAVRKLGQENLYRLLYEGIAPTTAVSSSGDLPEQLLFIERGCR